MVGKMLRALAIGGLATASVIIIRGIARKRRRYREIPVQ